MGPLLCPAAPSQPRDILLMIPPTMTSLMCALSFYTGIFPSSLALFSVGSLPCLTQHLQKEGTWALLVLFRPHFWVLLHPAQ